MVTYAAGGDALVTWRLDPRTATSSPRTALVSIAADGTIRSSTTLPRVVVAGPVPDPRGGALILTTSGDRFQVLRGLRLNRIAADGRLGRARQLTAANRTVLNPQLAVGDRGDAVIAWAEDLGTSKDGWSSHVRLRVATRPMGQNSFGAPRTVRDIPQFDTIYHPVQIAADVNAKGRAVVAFTDWSGRAKVPPRIVAWSGSARGRAWRGPSVAGTFAARLDLQAAITSDSRIVVGWGTQRHGEEPGSPWKVQAATLAWRAARFTPVTTLDPGQEVASAISALALEASPDGSATLAWGGSTRTGHPVKVVMMRPSGRFGTVQRITSRGVVGGLAVRADGTAVLVTLGFAVATMDEGRPVIDAAYVRGCGRAVFGPAEPIPPPAGASTLPSEWTLFRPGPAPAFDPVTGRPSIAYTVAAKDGKPAQLVVVTRTRP